MGASAVPTTTNYVWATTVLTDAGLPTTPNNVLNMVRWMASEEPPSNWYHNNNPLNINAGGSGSDSFPSLTASAQETASYLNMPNYTGIKAALASNAPFSSFEAAVVASPWAASHYGGGSSFFSGTPATVSLAGQTLVAGSPGNPASSGGSSVGGSSVGCGASSNKGIGGDLIGGLGDACQIKALTGGLLVGLGGAMLIIGGVLIFFGPGRARQVVRAASPLRFIPSGSSAPAQTATEATPEVETADTSDFDEGFMAGAASAGQTTPRNARQAQRQGELAGNRAGVARPGPGDRRIDRDRSQDYAF